MALRIICDSASDIKQGEFADVLVAPLTICFGSTSYEDGVDLSHQRFYELLIESDELPSTSQVTPFGFSEVLARALENDEDEALILTISSKLSGTYQSACLAAQEYGERVRVVDTLNASVGERIMVERARRLVAEGLGKEEVARDLEDRRGNVKLVALLDTLEYLRRGGRISNVAGALGTMLAIKPVISIVDGTVQVLGKARGSKNGRNLLSQLVTSAGGIDFSLPVCMGYAGLGSELLDKYVRDGAETLQGHEDQIPRVSCGATIGTHTGPGTIIIAFFGNR
ncbi:DegV family protein [Olsenella massiliensis]|uniref:DegV family protein n=1 Tax=Olsenella massiliensis TaxID=1622075 RepID=UPI00071C39C5|nr:DegV family protein [Olsenella massiliensis]